MIRLDCSGIWFGSQLDETHLFKWALEIKGVVRWEQDTLVVRSRQLSAESLRDLLALFHRYNIPMEQLAIFRSEANESWFTDPKKYWHKKVFPKKIIYVALLGEGTEVWRPVTANQISKGVFSLAGPVPAGEIWQFSPGTHVRCEAHVFSNGERGLVAKEAMNDRGHR